MTAALEEARQLALGWLGEALMKPEPEVYGCIEQAVKVLRAAAPEQEVSVQELIARALDESKLGGDLARAQVLATLALAQAMVEEQPELEELGYADGVFGVAWQAEQRR